MKMKRVNYHLSEKQIEKLKQISEEKRISVAELIRGAISEWIEKKEGSANAGETKGAV